ncbi:unnamed protein product [Strongylus vulgaris]|uniref:Uncharacterized protein n=1 Tax=Strongylus vulgaris TaxID=40348 RepID=A0A3P7JC06_STRVU|nr:unnamed protein product [Strongylus vulgaris]
MEIFNEFPIGKATYKRFCISKVDHSIRSGDVHVFIHKMEGTDLKEVRYQIISTLYNQYIDWCLI